MTILHPGSEFDNLLPVLIDKTHDQGEPVNLDLDSEKDKIDNGYLFFCCIPDSWIYSSGSALDNTPAATTVLLLNFMIGSGILVQAYVFKESGILVVTAEYVIVGIMSYAGIDLLIKSADAEQIFEYSDLARKALGEPGAIAVDLRLRCICYPPESSPSILDSLCI